MRQRGAHVRAALEAGALPLGNLMLETDAPCMRPDQEHLPDIKRLRRGQNEPCLLPAVCNVVAACYGLSPEAVAKATTANAEEFFRLTED